MIRIDYNKCVGCMSCVRVCPFNVIREYEGQARLDTTRHCIQCLHCAAICSVKAIDWSGETAILEDEPYQPTDDFRQSLKGFIKTRRSVRLFHEEPVPRKIVEEALDVAAYAPSAKNQHPSRWIVMDNQDIIQACMKDILEFVHQNKISQEINVLYEEGRNVVFGQAPTVVIGCANENSINPLADLALEAHTATLYLESMGISSCWAGYFARLTNQIDSIKDRIKVSAGERVYVALMLGYPRGEEYCHIPVRRQKQKISWID